MLKKEVVRSWSDKIVAAFEAVERVQLYCNVLGRATASLYVVFLCICYILEDIYTRGSRHLLYF